MSSIDTMVDTHLSQSCDIALARFHRYMMYGFYKMYDSSVCRQGEQDNITKGEFGP